jgi:hypothetical protein
MPEPIAAMTDLTHQFDDFFISLPAQRLGPGVEWADTTGSTRAGRATDTYNSTQVRRFRVERDTVIQGQAAVVLSVRSSARLTGASPVPGRPDIVSTSLQGEEEGLAVFAPASGRFVARTKRGTMRGELRISGGAAPVVMPQTYEYTSTISLRL